MFGARIKRTGHFRGCFYRESALLCQWQTMTIGLLHDWAASLALYPKSPRICRISGKMPRSARRQVRMRALRCKIPGNNNILHFEWFTCDPLAWQQVAKIPSACCHFWSKSCGLSAAPLLAPTHIPRMRPVSIVTSMAVQEFQTIFADSGHFAALLVTLGFCMQRTEWEREREKKGIRYGNKHMNKNPNFRWKLFERNAEHSRYITQNIPYTWPFLHT